MALTKFDLETTIITELSSRADELIPITEIYDHLLEKHPQISSKKCTLKYKKMFIAIVSNMESSFSNVYRFNITSTNYLIWSLKSRNEIASEKDIEDITPSKIDDFINVEDYKNYIDNAIENDDNFDPDEFITSSMTATHIIVKYGWLDTLKLINNIYDLDFDIKTKDEKTVFDIARESGDVAIMEYLMIIKYNNAIEYFGNEINEYKKIIQDKNNLITIYGSITFACLCVNTFAYFYF